MEDNSQATLRDTIESAFNNVEEGVDVSTSTERARDEVGRFKSATPEAEASQSIAITPNAEAPAVAPKSRPSSWKKDYEEHWGKLDPGLQEYILKRESDYATGVSTYKQQADSAKEMMDAIAPFMPTLQQHNIQPREWITNLGNAHRVLALGNPQEKQQMFMRLAQEYGVDLGQAIPSAPDQNYQYLHDQIRQLTQQLTGVTNYQQTQAMSEANQIVQGFATDAEKYPYFEQVRENMAQLLEAGIAPDLQTAYHMAVRTNDEFFEAEVARRQQEAEAKRQETVAKARAHAVSPRTATPSGNAVNGAKDRRSALEDAFQNVSGGRL